MKIKERLRRMGIGRNTLTFLLEMLIAGGMFVLLQFVFTPIGAFSMFPAAILLMMVGVGVLMYMTRMHMGGYTMTRALEEQNVSYAIIMLSYAIIIAAILAKI